MEADLGDAATLPATIDAIFHEASLNTQVDRVVLVNNAGSLSDIGSKVSEGGNLEALRKYTDLNLNSCVALT